MSASPQFIAGAEVRAQPSPYSETTLDEEREHVLVELAGIASALASVAERLANVVEAMRDAQRRKPRIG